MSERILGYLQFGRWRCRAVLRYYVNRRLAILLLSIQDGRPVARATVNVPAIYLGLDEVVIKDYSENTGMLEALVGSGIVTDTGRTVPLGHAAEGHICRLTNTAVLASL